MSQTNSNTNLERVEIIDCQNCTEEQIQDKLKALEDQCAKAPEDSVLYLMLASPGKAELSNVDGEQKLTLEVWSIDDDDFQSLCHNLQEVTQIYPNLNIEVRRKRSLPLSDFLQESQPKTTEQEQE